MDPEDLLAALFDGKVIHEDGDDAFRITDEFREATDSRREELSSLSDGELETALREDIGDDAASFLLEYASETPAFLARYCALSAFTELAHEELVRTVGALGQFFDEVREEGSPATFLPVHGDQLPALLAVSGPAVVYVWRDDCPPCEAQLETLEEAFEEPPEDVALFSVFGPDWAELLEAEYDVVAGPTTLFAVGNRVDSRLHGTHSPETIESEVDVLREVASP